MAKRARRIDAKPGQLRMAWGRSDPWDEPSIVYAWGDGVAKADANMLIHAMGGERMRSAFSGFAFDPSLVKELEARGYDLTTLKFSIQKKEQP